MPRTKEQNELIKEQRKDDLINAAIKVFATKGYERTTCDDIANTANCSHGLFYRYFTSKEDIYNIALLRYKTKYVEQITLLINESSSAEEGLKKVAAFFIDDLCSTEEGVCIAFFCLTSPIKSDDKSRNFDLDLFYALVDLIKKGQNEGSIIDNKDPIVLTMNFYFTIIGICFSKVHLKNQLKEGLDSSLVYTLFKQN